MQPDPRSSLSARLQAWAANRTSNATTLEGQLNDTVDTFVRKAQQTGIVPLGVGVNRPRDPVTTPEEAFKQIDGFIKQNISEKRGMAFDKITPASQSYRERRYDFLRQVEGIREFAYDDATGKRIDGSTPKKGFATVGVGFNMERKDAQSVFKNVLGLGPDQFNKVKNGEVPLSPDQIRRLFDFTIQEAEQHVARRLDDAPITEQQRIALVSMAFNNPELVGPNLSRMVKNGRFEEAKKEILYKSNLRRHRGLARRRYMEALMFSGQADTDVGDGNNQAAVTSLPKLTEYLKEFA